MTDMPKRTITDVAAFGERTVEAELLRNRWIPANFNSSVRNAADYDIAAQKRGRTILVSVKTCYAAKSFQIRFFKRKPDCMSSQSLLKWGNAAPMTGFTSFHHSDKRCVESPPHGKASTVLSGSSGQIRY